MKKKKTRSEAQNLEKRASNTEYALQKCDSGEELQNRGGSGQERQTIRSKFKKGNRKFQENGNGFGQKKPQKDLERLFLRALCHTLTVRITKHCKENCSISTTDKIEKRSERRRRKEYTLFILYCVANVKSGRLSHNKIADNKKKFKKRLRFR